MVFTYLSDSFGDTFGVNCFFLEGPFFVSGCIERLAEQPGNREGQLAGFLSGTAGDDFYFSVEKLRLQYGAVSGRARNESSQLIFAIPKLFSNPFKAP